MKKLWRALASVAAASFGVRSRQEHRQDLQDLPVPLLIAAAVIFTLGFVLGLATIVSWVV